MHEKDLWCMSWWRTVFSSPARSTRAFTHLSAATASDSSEGMKGAIS